MLKSASSHKFAAATALLPLVASVALMSACKPNQPPATSPGTQPPIWTGSPAPSSAEPTGQQGGTDSLTTQLIAPNGTKVATAKFEFNQGYVTITIETTGTGALSPGFHGVHIHSVGKCEANSVAPTGGEPGDFLSAGGHFMAPGHEHGSGDLTSLEVRKDGGALLETTPTGSPRLTCWQARALRSSFTPVPTISATSRRIATTRSTGHRGPIRRR